MINDRLNNLLLTQNIISEMQNGFRKHRACTQKIRQLVTMCELSKTTNQPLHVLYIDLRKAFDSVEFASLLLTLKRLGFDEKFVQLIEHMYQDNTTQIITPHGDTDKIKVQRGVKQGCPLSPVLFQLVLEPLFWRLEELKATGEIKGFAVDHNTSIVAPAYADDAALSSSTNAHLQNILDKYQTICEWNGLEIALERPDTKIKQKTVYTHNEKSADGNPVAHTLQVKFTNALTGATTSKQIPQIRSDECYRYLGLYTCLNLDWSQQISISEKKLKRTLGYLSARCFTDQQVVMVVNHVLLPAITYRMCAADYGKQ
jgi:hypothetical protein